MRYAWSGLLERRDVQKPGTFFTPSGREGTCRARSTSTGSEDKGRQGFYKTTHTCVCMTVVLTKADTERRNDAVSQRRLRWFTMAAFRFNLRKEVVCQNETGCIPKRTQYSNTHTHAVSHPASTFTCCSQPVCLSAFRLLCGFTRCRCSKAQCQCVRGAVNLQNPQFESSERPPIQNDQLT